MALSSDVGNPDGHRNHTRGVGEAEAPHNQCLVLEGCSLEDPWSILLEEGLLRGQKWLDPSFVAFGVTRCGDPWASGGGNPLVPLLGVVGAFPLLHQVVPLLDQLQNGHRRSWYGDHFHWLHNLSRRMVASIYPVCVTSTMSNVYSTTDAKGPAHEYAHGHAQKLKFFRRKNSNIFICLFSGFRVFRILCVGDRYSKNFNMCAKVLESVQ